MYTCEYPDCNKPAVNEFISTDEDNSMYSTFRCIEHPEIDKDYSEIAL